MAKRATKTKSQRQAELVERMAAADLHPSDVPNSPVPTHEEAIQGSYLASGVDYPIPPEIDESDLTEEEVESPEESDSPPPDEKIINSVVAEKYKNRYIENATAHGVKHKAAKRSNWDWLAQQIAVLCLNDKHALDMPTFVALLDANQVDHSRWTNRNKGWEGRFRMTGRVALQRRVVEQNQLVFPDGSTTVPTPDWVAKYSKES